MTILQQRNLELERSKIAGQHLIDDPQTDWLVYIFLDGDAGAALRQSIKVPPGHIHGVYCYGHAAETNHESVYWRLYSGEAQIYPTKAGNNTRNFIPVVAFWAQYLMNYPIYTDSELAIQLNVAPNDGCTFILLYMPIPMSRTKAKVPRSIFSKEEPTAAQYEVHKI